VDNQDGTKTIECDDGTKVTVNDGQDVTAPAYIPWAGGNPISRRVHAVHNGSKLHYPNETVGHSDGVPGRNWQIDFPQDIRNCESCHGATTTSGSWKTNPARLPCSGCHDSEAAQAHYKLMTYDPTPNAPWNGDEEESCKACHAEGAEVAVSGKHGIDTLLSTGEYGACPAPGSRPERCAKEFVTVTITGATADAAGMASMTFTVTDAAGNPVSGVDPQFAITQLQPATPSEAYNFWVPYIYRSGLPSRERNSTSPGYVFGTLVENPAGSYSYSFATDLSAVTTPQTVTYDRSLKHRVSIWFGGHAGPTGSATFDFTPDTNVAPSTETRDIVRTSACQSCHGEKEFHGHGGDRLTVEDCSMCHNPSIGGGAADPLTPDLKVMIHKIHAGGELASLPGPDGIIYDNPATPVDESADNGSYAIGTHSWEKMEFPAVIANCTKCHDGAGLDSDNWKTPSRQVCGSCHDTTSFVSPAPAGMTLHSGGAMGSDASCGSCHGPADPVKSVEAAHDWTSKDPRHTPEYGVSLSVSTPANGTDFEGNETPTVSIVLDQGGVPIDHTTVVQDDAKEGCTDAEAKANNCPTPDGKFSSVYLFVNGPRAKRNPVLTTMARVEVMSSSTGPFDLSAPAASFELTLDGGKGIRKFDSSGGDVGFAAGRVSVAVADGSFADPAAATVTEVVAWLNADKNFAARAIAYTENGKVAVRSRNLGDFFSLQLAKGPVTTAVFGGDVGLHTVGGYYPNNVVYKHTDPSKDDPKASWSSSEISYLLDPVTDLAPGTYMVSVEITDAGRVSESNYVTPTVGWTTFQVKQAAEELPVAGGCDSCHQNAAKQGFVLDYSRHNKKFGADAMDQCGGCHDYQPQN